MWLLTRAFYFRDNKCDRDRSIIGRVILVASFLIGEIVDVHQLVVHRERERERERESQRDRDRERKRDRESERESPHREREPTQRESLHGYIN